MNPPEPQESPPGAQPRLFFALGLAATVLAATTLPASAPPASGIVQADKVTHLLLFGLLATAVLRVAVLVPGNGRWAVGAAALWTAVFSLGTECLQAFLPWRYFEPADMLANLCGVGLAWFAYCRIALYRRVLEWRIA